MKIRFERMFRTSASLLTFWKILTSLIAMIACRTHPSARDF